MLFFSQPSIECTASRTGAGSLTAHAAAWEAKLGIIQGDGLAVDCPTRPAARARAIPSCYAYRAQERVRVGRITRIEEQRPTVALARDIACSRVVRAEYAEAETRLVVTTALPNGTLALRSSFRTVNPGPGNRLIGHAAWFTV